MLDAFEKIYLNLVFSVRSSIGSFDTFLYFGCMLTETATIGERLASAPPKDGRIWPSTSNKEDFSVVTSPVTAERERVSFYCRKDLFLCKRRPLSRQGVLGVSAFFIFVFNLILIFFFFSLVENEWIKKI